jgi:hypothetical protein
MFVTRISPYIYSVRYYPRFHVTAVGFGTYYPRYGGTPVVFKTEWLNCVSLTILQVDTYVSCTFLCTVCLYPSAAWHWRRMCVCVCVCFFFVATFSHTIQYLDRKIRKQNGVTSIPSHPKTRAPTCTYRIEYLFRKMALRMH